MPLVLWPVYHARNGPLLREAELSTSTLTALQVVAMERGPGAVVIVHDDRSSKLSLINPFGGFLQDAADLIVRPRIQVWLDPPAGPERPNVIRPSDVAAELRLDDTREQLTGATDADLERVRAAYARMGVTAEVAEFELSMSVLFNNGSR